MKWIILIGFIIICIKFWKKAHKKAQAIFFNIIENTNDETSKSLFVLFRFAIYATVLVFLINIFFNDSGKFGEWGDFFGGTLNPLLTFLTFMGLLITIVLQQSELKQSRKEFKGQKESLENQEFDNKFFQMLNLLNNIGDRLTLKINSTSHNGKDVFKYLKQIINNKIFQSYHRDVTDNRTIEKDKFKYFQNQFDNFNNDHDTTFKYYFINLYQILKYIDTYSINEKEAKEYTNMLRAQLTKNELILLAYNAIGVQSFTTNQYQLLVEKYAFFEHLRYDDFCENANIIQIINTILAKYDNKAFGNNLDLIDAVREQKIPQIEERTDDNVIKTIKQIL